MRCRAIQWGRVSIEYLIGTGGWAYFRVPGLRPLVAYSRAFNFVEVNSTFYQVPLLNEVEKWRKLVPEDFHFAVRAHRSITHEWKLKLTPKALETLEEITRICGILRADVLHFQTPASFTPSAEAIRDLCKALRLTSEDLRVALEFRGASTSNLSGELVDVMKENSVVHCVDLSKDDAPAYGSDMLYSRLFGKGFHNVYQPTDEELKQIDIKAMSAKARRVVFSFHFVTMYKDAARFKMYKQTGKFPMVTHSTGVKSLEEVLGADASFPSTKQELLRSQSWKLFDLTEDRRVRAGELLKKLPERTYHSVSDIIGELQSAVR